MTGPRRDDPRTSGQESDELDLDKQGIKDLDVDEQGAEQVKGGGTYSADCEWTETKPPTI